jgi:Xaa-Pro aminopeptidase
VKSDLDRLMQERGFDALVAYGDIESNHVLQYMTSNARISHAYLIKKPGEEPVLVVSGMEREEAAKSGLTVATTADFHYTQHIKEAGYFEGELRMIAEMFERYDIRGTVSFYGLDDPGRAFMTLKRLDGILPDVTITGETDQTIFDLAYLTKDSAEIAAIKSVAARTNTVMGEVMDFIKGHAIQNEQLVRPDGQPLTVADVKGYLRARLLEHNLEDGGQTIFALGRDGGLPHSRGEDGDVLRLGQSIVFDLFPRELGGGYYHDMTRTYCLGYAPPEVQEAYDQVLHIFNAVMEALTSGEDAKVYQEMTCDFFENQGHKTTRTDPGTEEGYVHSLGHGLGLQIHAAPRISSASKDQLGPGQVITVEPGLYYPERGFGVRIEDTVYVDEDGTFHSLTTYPKDLVIPMG